MQFRRVIDYLEGICILHNDPGIAQNLEITEQKSELTITNLNGQTMMALESLCNPLLHYPISSVYHYSGTVPD